MIVAIPDSRAVPASSAKRSCGGLTLIELLLAVGAGSIVLAGVLALSLYGARSFSVIGNFADLDAASRQAIDLLGLELRAASAVTEFTNNLGATWLSVTTNLAAGSTARVTWDSQARTLTLTAHGKDRILLNQCDYWEVKLYQATATPSPTNLSLVVATDPLDCKLIKMSWRCSRTNQGQQMNTECLQRLQFVLQNKFNYSD